MADDPFLFRGGAHGCLLVHGFTGNPAEMRGLGEHLAGVGLTVYGLRLPGHSGSPDDLASVHYRDWLAAVDAGLAYLSERCTTISLVGFSLGGALGLLCAPRRTLARLVLLATPLRLQGDWRTNLVGLARYTTPWFYPFAKANFDDPEIRAQIATRDASLNTTDPAVQEFLRHEVRISLAAVDELRRTLIAARAVLPQVRVPALVMHGRADLVAPADSAEQIIARLGSPMRELVWWDDTGHQLLVNGPHRLAIYERVAAFLAS